MKRSLLAASLLALSPILVPSNASAEPATKTACVEPVPDRNYGAERVVYAIVVDLSGCDWWDGGQIVLEATLARLDGQGETVAQRIALCGAGAGQRPADADAGGSDGVVRTPETSDGTVHAGDRPATWSGLCDVFADLDHPTLEAALYRGEITYPWAGETRTVGFSAQCGPPAGCVDLPADPSPALSIGAELYERLVGGTGDGH